MGKQSDTLPRPPRRHPKGPLQPALGPPHLVCLLLLLLSSCVSSPAQTPPDTALLLPTTVVFDASGNLYVAETNRHSIDRISPSGAVTVVAGNATQGYSGDAGPATAAQLDSPQGLAVDSLGNLYIADTHNHRIRMVLAASGIITTIAGNGVPGFSGDRAQAVTASLSLPTALALDSVGNLDIADSNNHRIRQLNLASGILTTIAGDGAQADAGDGSLALAASIDTPTGLAVDAADNLYLADTNNHRVRRIDRATGIITPVATSGLRLPRGLTLDAAGNLYVADSRSNRILRVAPDGTLSTFAGEGTQGFAGDRGPAAAALLDSPRASAVSPSGLLTVADTGNQRVRQLDPNALIGTLSGTVAPTALTLSAPASTTYGTGTLTATVSASTTPTGTVTFFETSSAAQQAFGSASIAANTAIFSTALLPAGVHQILAIYPGDANHPTLRSAVISLTITQAPISAAPAPASAVYGQSIPALNGTVSGILPQDASLVSAAFTTTARALSPAATYPISVSLSGPSAANYRLATLTSASLVISPAPTATALSTSASAPAPGSTVTFAARAVSTTLGLPTGSITFFDNAIRLGSTPVDPAGTATLSAALNAGSHAVTALYSGDANFLPSTSSSVSAVVSTSPLGSSDFTLAPAGATSQTATSGASATFPFAVAVLNNPLDSPILLSVTGMPVGATASFSPGSIPPGNASASFVLTIHTSSTSASSPGPAWPAGPIVVAMLPPICLRRRRLPIALGLACLLGVAGCGTTFSTPPQASTRSTTYPMTVIATSTSTAGVTLQHTATISLTLQ